MELAKQQIRDLFARYCSRDYLPTSEERYIIESGLEEILDGLSIPSASAASPVAWRWRVRANPPLPWLYSGEEQKNLSAGIDWEVEALYVQ